MCDYSLHNVKTRPAKVGDKLTTRQFGLGTRGFYAPEDASVAVCVLPGTELSFAEGVRRVLSWHWTNAVIGHKTAIFRQINQDNPRTHHDALEFPDGQIMLLTCLSEGQQATVLQLPAEPKTAVEAQSQRRVAYIGWSFGANFDNVATNRVVATLAHRLLANPTRGTQSMEATMSKLIRPTVLALCLTTLLPTPLLARDDGRFADSPLKPWFEHLASGKGLCCSFADGFSVQDVDWDTQDGHYRVRIYGQWFVVPDAALVTEPNRFGPAVVWPYRDRDGTTQIRCFMPGAGT
jgi:hypothetical protein